MILIRDRVIRKTNGESKKMINFSVGPVQMNEAVLKVGGEQIPYFRTDEFSAIMKENERLMLGFIGAPQGSRAVFLTGSGTASMEAAVMNLLSEEDKALVVNGGSFGQRFADLCALHGVPYEEIRLTAGSALTEEDLKPYENKGFTAFLVNIHETSTGVLYDAGMIGDFCRRNGLLYLMDAISSFLADPIDMESCGADVILTGSQKALACAPGVSIAMLSPRAQERALSRRCPCMYLDFASALKNGERGQTPFTPAVGTLLEIHERLKGIEREGGVAAEREKIASLARYFRKGIEGFPFRIASSSLSSAVTPLAPRDGISAYDIFTWLKDGYGIWVCPNGGALKEKIFRVGHIGALTTADYDTLFSALNDLRAKGKI